MKDNKISNQIIVKAYPFNDSIAEEIENEILDFLNKKKLNVPAIYEAFNSRSF